MFRFGHPHRRSLLAPVGAVARSGMLMGMLMGMLALAAARAGAQANTCSPLHPMVDGVKLSGNSHVGDEVIYAIITVEHSSIFRRWFGWRIGTITCLDSAEVAQDATEIANELKLRGFIGASVTGHVVRHGDRRATVRYDIHEGRPLTITRVDLAGLPGNVIDSARAARLLVGRPKDDSIVTAFADSLQGLLRDSGHARAAPPTLAEVIDSAGRTARERFTFRPGPLTYVGSLKLNITPSGPTPVIGSEAVRSAFAVRPGDQYSARKIADGQHALAALDLYRQVRVDTTSSAGATGAARDTIAMNLTVVEGARRRGNSSLGWGTLDCFRTQSRYVEQDVLGLGHRLELNGRLSKIGVADGLSGLQSLCATRVRSDPFSQHLNYYGGATIRLRGLAGWRGRDVEPEVSVFSERRSAIGAYEQTTDFGALATATYPLGDRLAVTVNYTFTNSKTTADRAVSCTRFGFCRIEDVSSFLLRTPQHSETVTLVKNPLLPTDDPQSGYRWSVEGRYGHATIGNQLPIDFGRFTAEAASYTPLGSWLTVALRAQIGAVLAPADRSFLLPPAERFYGGGQNSVRGYGQNLLGPGSYIVTKLDTITAPDGTQYGAPSAAEESPRTAPSGGNAMWLGNIELRTRRGWPTNLLKWVLFLDVGRVWNTTDVFSVTNADARATPGFGVRFVTPLGPFRMDIGYNPNGLETGPAFFVAPGDVAAGIPGRAICVSPGTDDPLILAPGQSPSANSCPATYLPPRAQSLFSRLTFHFSLGNAF